NPSSNPTPSTIPNPKGRNRRRSKQRIEDFNLEELSPPIVTMADQRIMAQLLQAPTEGYEDAIVGAARIWLEKEPPRSIFTWNDLVSKFINQFFPPSKTTNIRNEITNFQQRFDLSFSEAWDRFKDLLRACPHHGFSELHQLDTFNNALNSKDQDSLNSTAGATDGNVYRDNIQEFVSQASAVNYNQGNTNYRPPMIGVSYDGPQILPSTSFLPKVVENKLEVTKDTVNPTYNRSTEDVQPQVVQSESPVLTSKAITSLISEPVISPVSSPNPNTKSSIPYPSRKNDERNREKANNQIGNSTRSSNI
nr:reverse transcriptase domain-containing protein [Tanacetum cinerariifolium]